MQNAEIARKFLYKNKQRLSNYLKFTSIVKYKK